MSLNKFEEKKMWEKRHKIAAINFFQIFYAPLVLLHILRLLKRNQHKFI